ncbi:MAG: DUF4895 domain-containing protein [Fervidobacterium sp.]|nr:DUF4895 domain-containing protein [Fervidobacterium sp.]
MYIGPLELKSIESVDFDSTELLNFLESKKESLDVYHRHVAVVSCYRKEHDKNTTVNIYQRKFPFFMNFIVTTSNEKLIGISLSQPMALSPAIYKTQELRSFEYFKRTFEMITNEQCNLQCGIIKLPFKTKFIGVSGPEEFLKKEIYSEKILGYESFSFASKVDSELFQRIEKYKDGVYKICKTVINDDGINFFIIDKTVMDEFRPLLSEIVSLLRKKHNLMPAKYFSISEKIVGSFVLELNNLFSAQPFTQVDKFLEEYEKIKLDIMKHFTYKE